MPAVAKKPNRKLQATAYHEAGHAVVSFEVDRGVRKITIIPHKDSLGHCRSTPWGKTQPDEDAWNPRARGKIEKEILVLYSGGLAEAKFTGRRNHQGAGSDYYEAVNLASYVCGSDKELTKYLDWLEERARNIVYKPLVWRQIEALAAALLEKKTLTGQEARAIRVQTIQKALQEFQAEHAKAAAANQGEAEGPKKTSAAEQVRQAQKDKERLRKQAAEEQVRQAQAGQVEAEKPKPTKKNAKKRKEG